MVSLRTSLIGAVRRRLVASTGSSASACVLDHADGAVGVDEDLVGDAANVGLRHLIDAVHRAEQLAPIAVAGLIRGQLRGQAFIVGQAANEVGFGASLDHLQFVVGDVFFFD